ncbi:putative transcriptional regulatory protein C1F7.11c [Hypsizygus marmoreus]|uniref:Transcriptional regulatory protein C1F7.11c n=1 Tax=Hypsizygus marmoreus TaxID=39966 RepID=A0A369JV03_HYPMA|nr:putative transcriptional regulatory protein C1F7.11c [Hypsizygus marmoreus]
MNTKDKPSGSGKEKKTRRRLRLSCVECTKRRQKCDRKYPCSLCVSRGVPHLCRWETVPLARPAPARPPTTPDAQTQDPTVEELLARIAVLEKALENQNTTQATVQTKVEPTGDSIFGNSPSGSSTLTSTDTTSPCTSPYPDTQSLSPSPDTCVEDDVEPPFTVRSLLEPSVYATTSTLAQLSLGHHGEYIGRGSLICALHSISTGKTSRFLYAKSTDSTSAYREKTHELMSNSLVVRVEELIRNIPPVPITSALLQGFFAENNCRFGIPEEWFRGACSQMWSVLEYPGPHGVQINANWLCLLFGVLAYAPKKTLEGQPEDMNAECSDHYFTCAMTARRIAEDDHLNKPNLSLMVSAADGTVLSCLAVPLLCSYLSQKGRVSEAWKLVGNGIRNALAVGMHRDPEWKQWQVMSTDEVLLRRRAWWGLFIWDKLYSYLLGRPQMIRSAIYDVALPNPVEPDGTRNAFNSVQLMFIQLASLLSEALEKCFTVIYPSCTTFLEMDARLDQWEENLPPEYQQNQDTSDIDPADLPVINHQRHAILTWYLLCRAKLNIAAITGTGRPRQLRVNIFECRRLCVVLSMRLIQLQCETYEYATQYRAEHGGAEPPFPDRSWYFEGCFSLFEGTVALITTLTRYPWKEKTAEAEVLVDRAIDVLAQVVREEQGKRGEVARMATEVLGALRQESWWRAQTSNGSTPSVHDQTTYLPSILSTAFNTMDVRYDWFANTAYSTLFGLSPQHRFAIPSDPSFVSTGTSADAGLDGVDIHMKDVPRNP